MSIKVLCNKCSQQFTADDSRLGSKVACPRCFTVNEVLVAAESDEEVDISDGEYRLADDDAPVARNATSDWLTEAESGEDDSPATSARPSSRTPSSRTPAAPTPPAESGKSRVTCAHCGATLETGSLSCDACGKDTNLKELADQESPGSTEEEELEPGFRGWVQSKLSEGASLEDVMLWTQVAIVFFLAVLTYLWRPWFKFVSIPIAILLVIVNIVNWRRKSRGDATVTWYWLLSFARMTSWGFFKGPFAKRRAFSMRGKRFTDSDLESIPDPGSLDALDLENTQLTDDAIPYLQTLRDLKFLVIRGTSISEDASADLQLRLRQTWIWY